MIAEIGREGLGLKISAHGLRRSPLADHSGAPRRHTRQYTDSRHAVLRHRPQHVTSLIHIDVHYMPTIKASIIQYGWSDSETVINIAQSCR